MSTLESENKVITEKFIENAINDGNVDNYQKTEKNESEKLIRDEISNEKIIEIQPNVSNSIPVSCPANSTKVKEDLIDSISEETESSRDLKKVEAKEQEEAQQTTDIENDLEEDSAHGKEPKEEWQDILGSGVIMKKILKEGEPNSKPFRSDKCFINYTCRLEDAGEETLVDKGENYELGLGEGDVVQGLDVAIGLMNKNERCLLKIGSRLAYGTRGLPPNIPSDTTVVFDVELVNVRKEDQSEAMTIEERQRMGNKKRERGNWWYQRGENTLAIQCYRRALDFLDEVDNEISEESPSDSELQQLLEDRLKVLNNMASAQIKMELYDQAQMSLQSVLKCQPDNVKALFRKSKIYIAKNDLGQALKLLEKAKALEPDDPLIIKEITIVTGLMLKQKNSEREYARRMFGSTSTASSGGKTRASGNSKNSRGSKFQVWATVGATLFVGLAGIVAYKFRYP